MDVKGSRPANCGSHPTTKQQGCCDEAAVSEIAADNPNKCNELLSDARVALNQIASAVHVAEEATQELERLVRGIEGIVEQASSEAVPQKRRAVLETEAKEIAAAISKKARNAQWEGKNPFEGEPWSVNLPFATRPPLVFKLPKNALNGLGLNDISFARPDLVSESKCAVNSARQWIAELKNSLDLTHRELNHASAELEVAIQNAEASCNTVRDLNIAVALADQMKLGVAKDPNAAMAAFNPLGKRALELLED